MSNLSDWESILKPLEELPGGVIIKPITHRKHIYKATKWTLSKTPFSVIDVVIAGLPHIGKTELAKALSKKVKKKASQSLELEKPMAWDEGIVFGVIPGHECIERKKAFNAFFKNPNWLKQPKRPKGLIYVVSWGYRSNWEEDISSIILRYKGIKNLEKLREHNLELEITDFQKIIKKIDIDCLKWVMIVATRVDLYFKEFEEVVLHYHPKVNNSFQDALKNMGLGRWPVSFAPICALQEDFKWGDENIQSNLGQDADVRFNLFEKLFEKIAYLDSQAVRE